MLFCYVLLIPHGSSQSKKPKGPKGWKAPPWCSGGICIWPTAATWAAELGLGCSKSVVAHSFGELVHVEMTFQISQWEELLSLVEAFGWKVGWRSGKKLIWKNTSNQELEDISDRWLLQITLNPKMTSPWRSTCEVVVFFGCQNYREKWVKRYACDTSHPVFCLPKQWFVFTMCVYLTYKSTATRAPQCGEPFKTFKEATKASQPFLLDIWVLFVCCLCEFLGVFCVYLVSLCEFLEIFGGFWWGSWLLFAGQLHRFELWG